MSDPNDTSASDASIGQTIGPYRVEELLGVGGMGRVYRASGPNGESVALKVVKAELASDETFRKRFDREARVAQQVKHPHVVEVLDTGQEGSIPYLAQRYVSSGNLQDRIQEQGTLPIEYAIGACVQVGAGLDALHANGLIHRDVKPANILLDEEGHAHITDFGLAKDTQGSLLTRPGQTVGSLDYMAPEQIRGEEVGATTDVYALGCVLYECLTGTPPFADRQGMRVLWAHIQDPPADPATKRAEISPQLAQAVLAGLAKEASERPQSASEYAEQARAAAGL